MADSDYDFKEKILSLIYEGAIKEAANGEDEPDLFYELASFCDVGTLQAFAKMKGYMED